MTLSGLLLVVGVLVLFVSVWYGLSYVFSSELSHPDGYAKVTGSCGDTMELAFTVEQGRIARTHAWTDGCTTSRSCIDAAARLAYGRRPEELERLTMMDIIDDIGSLPESHLHCAQLAEATVARAVADFHERQQCQADDGHAVSEVELKGLDGR